MKSPFRHTSPFMPEPPNQLWGAISKPRSNPLVGPFYAAPRNALLDIRPKSEFVPGHYRRVPFGLGYRVEWIAGYWRREG